MENVSRKPFQGVTNIIRFNWHFYVFAFALVALLLFIKQFLPEQLIVTTLVLTFLILTSITFSLAASYYIYDCSNLYTLDWLDDLNISVNSKLVNINAGFDETSVLLSQKFPTSSLTVFDFYDPNKHTEISIERARKAYPAFPETKTISTNAIPLKENSIDIIFLVLAAHEIRIPEERTLFFKQLHASLTNDGKIIVVEHQRDLSNFIAYNFGFFHFHSKKTWRHSFKTAELILAEEFKITPFIATFILKKNGSPS
ncbi:MAG TPA: class I SAM-dependent methyltransferase [Cytophagaceae bacterium]|jgi:hypothetical protein|nr:class I SAM-dependent methyltransferase [Cytophagaceae bacterium]